MPLNYLHMKITFEFDCMMIVIQNASLDTRYRGYT
jgi:hypothetical protein